MDERDSTEQFSSIFTDNNFNNFKWERKLNCSEGAGEVARLNSPIRESILNSSSRVSNDGHQHRLTKQRSQHSLIIESVARILDESDLEDPHKPEFRTGPPSEVHQNFMQNNVGS